MNKEEKRAAAEQLARNRAVRGFAFRLGDSQEDRAKTRAIQEFLKGGPCPEGYRAAYLRERENLMLGPKCWYEAFADAAHGLIPGWTALEDLNPEQEAYCLRAADSIANRPEEEK